MKKYLVFFISFVLLHTIFQTLSGWVLSAIYAPDLSAMENNLSEKVGFSYLPLLGTYLAATIAYFLSRKISL